MTDSIDYGKPPTGFTRIGTSLEPTPGDLGVETTPIDRFFVCSASSAPVIDASTWSLAIDGDAVPRPVTLSMNELEALPHHRVESWLECAGNGRAMFNLAGGYETDGIGADTAWTLGAMGMASWTGPTLRSVLDLAEPTGEARWVGPEGLDVENSEGAPARMSLPIEKARHDDTIVALRMNGEPLAAAHGYPVRLLVPGWVGAYSIKWLGRLEVSSAWVPSWRADEYYVHRTPDGAKAGPVTAHPVKSCLALDWPANLAAGRQTLRGYARCGSSPVVSVEWSLDDGAWQPAALDAIDGAWAWAPFTINVDLAPGGHQIRTRAVTADGQSQPEFMPLHPNTILWNAITRHPIVAT